MKAEGSLDEVLVNTARWHVALGDCRERLRAIPDGSVHCVVTSPPYFGLRDYQTATWEGGDPACAHDVERWDGPKQTQGAQSGHAAKSDRLDREWCQCGARRVDQQIGMEGTPAEYVAAMVDVFREVRRVLRGDGTLWCNVGDSYAVNGGCRKEPNDKRATAQVRPPRVENLAQKNLLGIPWRVAIGLQDDDWILRCDVVWHKRNGLPESVTDRPTRAHEYVFLLTKSPDYFYDATAIAEPTTCDRMRGPSLHPDLVSTNGNAGLARRENGVTRNARSVWSFTSEPFASAHFATMPPSLARRCVLAGTSAKGCCAKCGAPWERGDAGWRACCSCDAPVVPCVVLDPFSGAGTTGLVALQEGRRYLGCELNVEYIAITRERLRPFECDASSPLRPKVTNNGPLFGGG